jgi:hypothetical protein
MISPPCSFYPFCLFGTEKRFPGCLISLRLQLVWTSMVTDVWVLVGDRIIITITMAVLVWAR